MHPFSLFSVVFTLLLTLLFSLPATADAASIAAIVGNSVITTTTLEQRIKLAAATTPLPDRSPATLESLAPQILQMLIDEALYRQEAERHHISVSAVEIDRAIQKIETQNNQPEGSLKPFILSLGIPFSVFEEQLRSQILWHKVINFKIRPRLSVSESELNEAIYKLYPKDTHLTYRLLSLSKPLKALPENEDHAPSQFIALRAKIHHCRDLDSLSLPEGAILSKAIKTNYGALDNQLKNLLVTLPEGQPSRIVTQPERWLIAIVCERTTRPLQEIEKSKITDSILLKKSQTQANHYLRELRRNTVIEIRLPK